MLSQLFSSNNDNCFVIAKILLAHLKVAVTKISLLKDLQQHPDYPSLLSLSDVLTGYGVENISFKSSPDSLRKIPIPFIAQIKGENSQSKFFTLVDEIKDNSVHYYNPEKNYGEKINVENFIKKWQSGIVLIANAENAPGEKNYIQKLREEKRMEMSKYAAYIALPALVIIASVLAFINYGVSAIFPIIFSLITLLGCIVGSLLILYELDQYNPVLHQICSAGKKINCGAILNSKASKIAGISWSTIGFTYFAGGLFTLLCI
jgi:ABC-type bacteriocin/lantibiotic exporter with double-glycine peptidase domain